MVRGKGRSETLQIESNLKWCTSHLPILSAFSFLSIHSDPCFQTFTTEPSLDISLDFVSWPNGKRCRDGRGMGESHVFSRGNCRLPQASPLLDLLLFFS